MRNKIAAASLLVLVFAGLVADAETPSGTVNGSNVTFTLAHTPNPTGSCGIAR
jgi:hypothetical protein